MIRLFRVSIPTSILLLLLGDALLITICYAAAAFLAVNDATITWLYIRYEGGWFQILVVVLIILLSLYMMDFYSELRILSRTYLVQQMCLLLGFSFLVQALIGYSELVSLQLPQWTMVYGSAFLLVGMLFWRTLFLSLVRNALPGQKLLMVGSSPVAEQIAATVQSMPELGFRVIGHLDSNHVLQDVPYMGPLEELLPVVRQHKPDRVIVCPQASQLPVQALLDLRMNGFYVEAAGELYEQIFGRVSIRDLQPSQVIFSRELGPQRWMVSVQTVYSFVFGLVGTILFLPVMLVVAILVKLTSPGPAIYSQRRTGRFGKPFSLYKFRSMYVDAESRTGPVWASKNDPRVTPLGRWLRKLRLDELPQFYNVLRGDMALVGPRPERPEFCAILEKQILFYQQRHFVKPGITGWAQINHKYTETVEDTVTKLEYDLYYVKHLTPTLDAYIIFHTLKVMLLSRGAQ
jgi:exopolysaccharide biosynthesis polyprenyl glycosylphosphotransferase